MAITKKDSTTKNNTTSVSSVHPPYLQMISEAITTMKDRSGSSQPSIAKFIEQNYAKQLPPHFKKILSVQLKNFVKSEKLIKVKNSYKIAAVVKVKKSSPPAKATKVTYTETEEKSKKTKRLSQVKTPEALKKKTAAKTAAVAGEKMKKDKSVTPMKRKMSARLAKTGSSPPLKKAKK